MDQLYSKVHDERQCLTVKTVSIELGINRCEAAAMLEDLLYYNKQHHCTYEVTRTISMKDATSKGYAVKLFKSRLSIDTNSTKPSEHEGSIFSIALVEDHSQHGSGSAPSARTGQAFSLAAMHDALVDGNLDILAPIISPSMASCRIRPSQQVSVLDSLEMRNARITGALPDLLVNVMSKSNSATTQFPQSAHRLEPTQKATGSHESSSSKLNNKASGKKITTASSFFQTSNATVKSKAEKSNVFEEKKPDTDNSMIIDTAEVATEKENIKHNLSSVTTKTDASNLLPGASIKGSADDFVGDQDEDDEFLRQEEQRMKRLSDEVAKDRQNQAMETVVRRDMPAANSRPRSKGVHDLSDDYDVNESKAVTGSMDSFSTKLSQESQVGAKRRKQVLEERTYQDENGYLKTETVSVWKEVESSGVADIGSDTPAINGSQGSNPKQVATIKSTKNMKQTGLMGFFSAKK